jgi:hypothetical protein
MRGWIASNFRSRHHSLPGVESPGRGLRMTPERWVEIEELYHSAWERPADRDLRDCAVRSNGAEDSRRTPLWAPIVVARRQISGPSDANEQNERRALYLISTENGRKSRLITCQI